MSSKKSDEPPKRRGRPEKYVDPKTLGGKIRAARKQRGLTTQQLADAIGVSNPTITDTETNKTKPERSTLILLARELRDFFGLEWLKAYVQPPLNTSTQIELPPSLFDEGTLKNIPEDQLIDYLHLVKDALQRLEAKIEAELKRRTRRPKR